MAKVHIHFAGGWQVLLGVRTQTIEAADLNAVQDFIESRFGPVYREKLRARGIHRTYSIWDNSHILMNQRNIGVLAEYILKDGDTLCLLPKAAGG